MSFIIGLIGERITEINSKVSAIHPLITGSSLIEHSTSVCFNNYRLDIYNPVKLLGLDNKLSIHNLTNLSVVSCIESADEIIIELENQIKLIVDMRDESFIGPEALCLHGPNNLMVVWN